MCAVGGACPGEQVPTHRARVGSGAGGVRAGGDGDLRALVGTGSG